MNKLPTEKRAQIIKILVEGNSLRSTSRIADVSINTIVKLLIHTGKACQKFHDYTVTQLQSERILCDEIWSFVDCKEKGVNREGHVWTWTALDTDTKIIISWAVGDNGTEKATEFLKNVRGRIQSRLKLTTDGHRLYLQAVRTAFDYDVDNAILIKMYGVNDDRLTDIFSEKIEKHSYAIALHFVYYNFVKIHSSLSVTPAMQAGLIKKPMTIEDILNLA